MHKLARYSTNDSRIFESCHWRRAVLTFAWLHVFHWQCLGEATVSLKAVAKNGVAITPTNHLFIAANDTITAEVFFSGWGSPPFVPGSGLLQVYQAALLGAAGAVSNGADPDDNTRLVLPMGWDAPVVRDSCPCDNPLFPICHPFFACVGGGHNHALMATINTNCVGGSCTGGCCVSNFRSDFIFYGFDSVHSVDTATLNIRWGGTLNDGEAQSSSRCTGGDSAGYACTTDTNCPDGTCNAAYQSYTGTLNLKVGSDPCGTYTFNFHNYILQTFIGNETVFPGFALPLIQPLTLSVSGTPCPEVICSEMAPVTRAPGIAAETRFISYQLPSPSCESALRVRLSSLHHVLPTYSGGPSVPFTQFEGEVRWVGPPVQYLESASGGVSFYASSLQCTPHYQNWSTIGLLHVTGSAIVPSSVYEVESVAASCMGSEAICTAVSAPLQVLTARWGDVETPFNPPSTTVQPDVTDISALVNKFRSAPGAPIKARALLAGAPGNSFGEITPEVLSVDIGFSHISACVDAFRGVPYPYTIATCP